MKKIILPIMVAASVFYIVNKSSTASSAVSENFSSPAAEESYVLHGDMSRNMTDQQVISAIKSGHVEENFTRTASCSSGCTVNCSRSCSTCCSHQCGRGY